MSRVLSTGREEQGMVFWRKWQQPYFSNEPKLLMKSYSSVYNQIHKTETGALQENYEMSYVLFSFPTPRHSGAKSLRASLVQRVGLLQ